MEIEASPQPGPEPAIRTLLVDDESLARENLRIRLRNVRDFEVVGECATGKEAIGAVAALKPNVMFLDVRMPDMDGLSVVQSIKPDAMPVIVFVTAYDRYALDAFRVHAADYLLKPFDEARFAEMLLTCRRRVADARGRAAAGGARGPDAPSGDVHSAPQDSGRPSPCLDRLVIKNRGRIFFLKIGSVDWIEACADYVSLHVGEKDWLLRRTMHDMEARLNRRTFVRISRSAIVNLDRVQELLPAMRGEHVVRLVGGRELKLTRNYRDRLEALLGDRL